MSSNMTEIYFWVLDSHPEQISLVTIDKTQMVIHLRAVIKCEKGKALQDHDTDTLALGKFFMKQEEAPMHLAWINLDCLLDCDKLRLLHVIPNLPRST